jgi:TM2 domain-containing membrane protein YozV
VEDNKFQGPNKDGVPPDLDKLTEADKFFEERMERLHQMPPPRSNPYDPFTKKSRKSKFAAGLLAFFIPGLGHFYLGLMQRGLFIMLALIADIYAIVHTATANPGSANVPLITLFGMLVPVIYFFNIFDALQSTDSVNEGSLDGSSIHDELAGPSRNGTRRIKGASLGWLLVAGGCIVLLISNKPSWMSQLFEAAGSYVGAGILISAGAYLFLRERKQP